MPMYDIGFDSYIGDDDDDLDALLGAYEIGRKKKALARRPPPRMAQRSSPAAFAQAMRKADTQAILSEVEPTKTREYPLGFDSVNTVAAGAAATINQQPQVLYRPNRLVVATNVAPNFVFTDIRIGKNSQLPAVGALTCDAFAPNAVSVDVRFDTAQVNSIISLAVQNISGAAQRFLATMFGQSVE